MSLRGYVFLVIVCATLWHGRGRFASGGGGDTDEVRVIAAKHLELRFGDRFPGESVQVTRGTSEREFVFAAPVEFEDGARGTISGVARWNGVVYEIDPRVRIR